MTVRRIPAAVLAAIVRGYKWAISPLLAPACRYTPTCSDYALEALERHGALRGSVLAIWRLLRCHPFARGGFDPVPIDLCGSDALVKLKSIAVADPSSANTGQKWGTRAVKAFDRQDREEGPQSSQRNSKKFESHRACPERPTAGRESNGDGRILTGKPSFANS